MSTGTAGHAIAQLCGYLDYLKIPHAVGLDGNICVGGHLAVIVSETPRNAPEGSVVVVEGDILSPRSKDVLGAIWTITRAIDGTEPPLRIPDLPKERANSTDDPWGVILRHRELLRSHPVTQEQLAKYQPIVNREVWRFWYSYQKILRHLSWEKEDLSQLALAWLVNYCSHYHITGQILQQDRANLSVYLRSKFNYVRDYLIESACQQVPDHQDYQFSTRGTMGDDEGRESIVCPTCGHDQFQYLSTCAIETDACQTCEAPDTDCIRCSRPRFECVLCHSCFFEDALRDTECMSKKRAEHKLIDKLDALPHEQLVGCLNEAMDNLNRSYDIRHQACIMLRRHIRVCPECQANEELVDRVKLQQEAAIIDPLRRGKELKDLVEGHVPEVTVGGRGTHIVACDLTAQVPDKMGGFDHGVRVKGEVDLRNSRIANKFNLSF